MERFVSHKPLRTRDSVPLAEFGKFHEVFISPIQSRFWEATRSSITMSSDAEIVKRSARLSTVAAAKSVSLALAIPTAQALCQLQVCMPLLQFAESASPSQLGVALVPSIIEK